MDLETLKYPIGRFTARPPLGAGERASLIDEIAALPAKLEAVVTKLDDAQLATPYRPDGWTVRQVVHHVPDSHMNAYIRFKLALTEDVPTIKPYNEAAWALLPDAEDPDIASSLQLLAALHRRWTTLLRAIPDDRWNAEFRHPERGIMSLDTTMQLYHWHGRHHLAHITTLIERSGW